MTTPARTLVEQHWQTANARDWAAFAALLHPDLVYDVPQTRERVRTRAGYTEFFRTWPGPWRADVKQLIADDHQVVSILDFVTADGVMTGISVFTVREGLIAHVTDYWPAPYEPPPRQSASIERY